MKTNFRKIHSGIYYCQNGLFKIEKTYKGNTWILYSSNNESGQYDEWEAFKTLKEAKEFAENNERA